MSSDWDSRSNQNLLRSSTFAIKLKEGITYNVTSVKLLTNSLVTTQVCPHFSADYAGGEMWWNFRLSEKGMFSWRITVWTVGLSVKIKLRIQISPAQYGRCLNSNGNRIEIILYNMFVWWLCCESLPVIYIKVKCISVDSDESDWESVLFIKL